MSEQQVARRNTRMPRTSALMSLLAAPLPAGWRNAVGMPQGLVGEQFAFPVAGTIKIDRNVVRLVRGMVFRPIISATGSTFCLRRRGDRTKSVESGDVAISRVVQKLLRIRPLWSGTKIQPGSAT